jgi:hypothetical protein
VSDPPHLQQLRPLVCGGNSLSLPRSLDLSGSPLSQTHIHTHIHAHTHTHTTLAAVCNSNVRHPPENVQFGAMQPIGEPPSVQTTLAYGVLMRIMLFTEMVELTAVWHVSIRNESLKSWAKIYGPTPWG